MYRINSVSHVCSQGPAQHLRKSALPFSSGCTKRTGVRHLRAAKMKLNPNLVLSGAAAFRRYSPPKFGRIFLQFLARNGPSRAPPSICVPPPKCLFCAQYMKSELYALRVRNRRHVPPKWMECPSSCLYNVYAIQPTRHEEELL